MQSALTGVTYLFTVIILCPQHIVLLRLNYLILKIIQMVANFPNQVCTFYVYKQEPRKLKWLRKLWSKSQIVVLQDFSKV
jgi:hypothetical protein